MTAAVDDAIEEYAVMLPLAPLPVGTRVRRDAWPRHVTVVPNLRVGAGAVDALAAIVRETAAGRSAPGLVVGGLAMFGPDEDIPVQLVHDAAHDDPALTSLHAELDAAIDAWAAEAGATVARQRAHHHGAGYRPHVTVTADGPLETGARMLAPTLALVEIGPDGDEGLAESAAVATFGEAADGPVVRAAGAAAVCAALDDAGVRYAVVGGWGVDALLGRETRDHHDLDLLVEHADLPRLLARAGAAGGGIRYRWSESRRRDGLPTAFVATFDGVDLDVHTMLTDGDRVRLASDSALELPPGALTATGTIAGMAVRCASVGAQRLMHTGYELPVHHRRDLELLAELEA